MESKAEVKITIDKETKEILQKIWGNITKVQEFLHENVKLLSELKLKGKIKN